jgi:hypothetical protein
MYLTTLPLVPKSSTTTSTALEAEAPRFVRCGRLAQGVNAGYLDH